MEERKEIKFCEIDKQVIERYVGRKDYVVRIRLTKKNKLEINVYYDGRKSFDVKGGKLELDGAYFFLKGKKEFSSPTKTEIECLKALGFSFCVGSGSKSRSKSLYDEGYKYRIYVEPSTAEKGNPGYYGNYVDQIKEKMDIIKEALKEYADDVYHVCDEDNVNNFYIRKDDNVIDYSKLEKLLEIGINNTVGQKGLKKITFNEKMVSSKNSYTEVEYKIIDAIMEERISEYNRGLSQIKEEDDDDEPVVEKSEKEYQQLLMNKMFNKEEREILLSVDNCPFKGSEAYEMEYNLYEDERKKDNHPKNKKHRTLGSKKGRVDNIFISGNKVIFTELKYDENVIGSTNGIHKHLIDLINGFEKNEEVLEEIYDYVCDYNEVLSYFDEKKEFMINDVRRFKDKEALKEFVIICGYSKGNRDTVLNKLKEIYPLTGKDKEKRVVIKKEYELDYEGKNLHLEELTGKELVSLLKDRYNCETKIYLANDNYTEFEQVNYLLK